MPRGFPRVTVKDGEISIIGGALLRDGGYELTRVEFQPGRWWRVIAPDGSLWAETSNENEARGLMRSGDRLQRQWTRTEGEWRDESEGIEDFEALREANRIYREHLQAIASHRERPEPMAQKLGTMAMSGLHLADETGARCVKSSTGEHRWHIDGISGRWACADCWTDGGDGSGPPPVTRS